MSKKRVPNHIRRLITLTAALATAAVIIAACQQNRSTEPTPTVPSPGVGETNTSNHALADVAGFTVVSSMEISPGRSIAIGDANPHGDRPIGLIDTTKKRTLSKVTVFLSGTAGKPAIQDLPGHPKAVLLTAMRDRNAPQFAALGATGDALEVLNYYDLTAPAPLVTKGHSLLVDKQRDVLYRYLDGKLVKSYRVATGRQVAGPPPSAQDYLNNFFTPEGHFTIDDKEMNPVYHGGVSGHPPAAGGAPENPLGPRWMGFNVVKGLGPKVWGIHGTSEPDLIGGHESDGCIRMYSKDVTELFDQIPLGTSLDIMLGRT